MIYVIIVLVMLFIVWNIGSFGVMMEYGPGLTSVDDLHDVFINICMLYWVLVFGCFAVFILFIFSSAIACGVLEDTKYSDCKICSFLMEESE